MNQTNLASHRKWPSALGMISCAVLLISGCAPDPESQFIERQSPARGATVFDYNCGFCHGAEGRAPALSEIRSLSTTERRNKIINHPIAGQIPQRLAAHELSDLIEFFESEENPGGR